MSSAFLSDTKPAIVLASFKEVETSVLIELTFRAVLLARWLFNPEKNGQQITSLAWLPDLYPEPANIHADQLGI
jgi:hypothetical protein